MAVTKDTKGTKAAPPKEAPKKAAAKQETKFADALSSSSANPFNKTLPPTGQNILAPTSFINPAPPDVATQTMLANKKFAQYAPAPQGYSGVPQEEWAWAVDPVTGVLTYGPPTIAYASSRVPGSKLPASSQAKLDAMAQQSASGGTQQLSQYSGERLKITDIIGYRVDGSPIYWNDILARFNGNYLIVDPETGQSTPFFPNMTRAEWIDKYAQRFAQSFFGSNGYVGPWGAILSHEMDMQRDTLGDSGNPFGGGGYGRMQPTYVAPDPDAVREQIRNYVIATTGRVDENIIEHALTVFLAKHREAFDMRETQEIDPWQAVKGDVRTSAVYQTIHDGRPDSIDELEWVTSRQGKLRQLGIADDRAELMGVEAAVAGSSDEALIGQAKVGQQTSTGKLLNIQRDSLLRSAAAALELVR